jgi:hypothetical protein
MAKKNFFFNMVGSRQLFLLYGRITAALAFKGRRTRRGEIKRKVLIFIKVINKKQSTEQRIFEDYDSTGEVSTALKIE